MKETTQSNKKLGLVDELLVIQSALEYAVTLPAEKMLNEIKNTMSIINTVRVDYMKNSHLHSLTDVIVNDLHLEYEEAYKLIEDSFNNLYVRGGSVETYEVLEQAYRQYEHNKMENSKEITIAELLKDTTPAMKEILLKRAEQHQEKGKAFEAYYGYSKDNYFSRVNAEDLLSLENGIKDNLQQVQESLSMPYSADSQLTVREVLEDE